MFFQPVFNDVAMMNLQIINDQKYFFTGIFDQSFHELYHRLGIHFVFVDVEKFLYKNQILSLWLQVSLLNLKMLSQSSTIRGRTSPLSGP